MPYFEISDKLKVIRNLVIGSSLLLLIACRTEIPFDPGPLLPDPIDTMSLPTDTSSTTPGDTISMPDTSSIDLSDTIMAGSCDTSIIYFDTQILPILVGSCAYAGCHDAQTAQNELIFDSYANLFRNDDAVIPFDLKESELYEKITEDDVKDRMPPAPAQALTQEQIFLIGKWILQGAKDSSCSAVNNCDTTVVSYATAVQPILNTYCVTCHGSSNPNGGVSLNNYSRVQQAATSGKLYGVISWATGFVKMPLGGDQIPDCDINKIDAWINQGILNN